MMGMKSLFVYEEQDTFSVSELNDFNCALLAYFDHGFLVQKRNLPMYNAWQQEAKEAYQKNHKLPIYSQLDIQLYCKSMINCLRKSRKGVLRGIRRIVKIASVRNISLREGTQSLFSFLIDIGTYHE